MNRFTANGKDLWLLTRWNAGAIRPWPAFPRRLRPMPPGPSPAGHTGHPAHCRHLSPRGRILGAAARRARFFDGARALHQHPDPQRAASLRVIGVQEARWPQPAVRKTGQDRAIPEALHDRGQLVQMLPLRRSVTRMAGISRRSNAEDWCPPPEAAVRAMTVSVPPRQQAARTYGVCTAPPGQPLIVRGSRAGPSAHPHRDHPQGPRHS